MVPVLILLAQLHCAPNASGNTDCYSGRGDARLAKRDHKQRQRLPHGTLLRIVGPTAYSSGAP